MNNEELYINQNKRTVELELTESLINALVAHRESTNQNVSEIANEILSRSLNAKLQTTWHAGISAGGGWTGPHVEIETIGKLEELSKASLAAADLIRRQASLIAEMKLEIEAYKEITKDIPDIDKIKDIKVDQILENTNIDYFPFG